MPLFLVQLVISFNFDLSKEEFWLHEFVCHNYCSLGQYQHFKWKEMFLSHGTIPTIYDMWWDHEFSSREREFTVLLGWSPIQALGGRRQGKFLSSPNSLTHPRSHTFFGEDGWAIVWCDRKSLLSFLYPRAIKNSSWSDPLSIPFSPLCVTSWISECACHFSLFPSSYLGTNMCKTYKMH